MNLQTHFTSGHVLLLCGGLILGVCPAQAQTSGPRQRLSFNADWRFHRGQMADANPSGANYPLQKWRWKSGNDLSALTANTDGADWKDTAPGDDVFQKQKGFAWFRTTLQPLGVSAKASPLLRFSGVDDNATVYLNGRKLLTHKNWELPFDVPLDAAWKPNAPNELAVLVENTTNAGGIGPATLEIDESGASAATKVGFDDSQWRRLDLPHDWGIEGPFNIDFPGETGKLPWSGIGWYRKRFNIPQSDKGRRIALEVDGAMSNAKLWLNGQFVGEWPYGYASWSFDLTPFLRIGGENVLAIRLDNKPESSRWYPGGGLYRDVWLSKTAPLHVAHWGTQVSTQSSGANTQISAKTTLQNEGAAPRKVLLTSTILDANNKAVAATHSLISLAAGASQTIASQMSLANAKPWSLKNPYRYTLVSQVTSGRQVLDRYQTPFGVRSIEWSAQKGFLLNGVRVSLNGVCLHHDLGALGAAWNRRAAQRQLEILRGMGVNAIRTSHNPPAPGLLDLCDEMGFLVLDEFSDTWKWPKKANGYARLFDQWADKDLRAMLRRDRNHPSIIAWSIGNEVGEQWHGGGDETARFLAAIVHSEDTSRPVTSGNNVTEAGFSGFQKATDVFGYNYKPGDYARFRVANPNIPLFGSETASTVSSRGEYVFPVSNDKSANQSDHLNFQVSSYDLYAPPWGSIPDTEFEGQDKNPFVAGEFVWTGFDYLGEPYPYDSYLKAPSRSAYFGMVDLAGFPKDRFYLYQSRWRPDLPMAHILPHWNWPERVGQVTPVHVYTSGDEAELFLNGQSQGRRKKGQYQYRLRWDDVVYQPGELRVVAYKNGKEWAQETVKTTGAPAKITLEADRSRIASDGNDLSFVTVRITDAAGLVVPRAKNALQFSVSGPGEIVATDNGNATDMTSFHSRQRNAYNGLALVIVRARKGANGSITLRATSPDLVAGQTIIAAGR